MNRLRAGVVPGLCRVVLLGRIIVLVLVAVMRSMVVGRVVRSSFLIVTTRLR